jgi:ribosomal protein S2
MFKLRKALLWIAFMAFSRKLIFVNTSTNSIRLEKNTIENLKVIARKRFLISAHKWIGGSLTNYRNIYKSLYSIFRISEQILSDKRLQYKEAIKGLLVKRVPKLPALFISLGDNHYALNEARSLGLKTISCVETNYGSYLFGDITIACNMSDLVALTLFHMIQESIISGSFQDKLFFKEQIKNYQNNYRKIFEIKKQKALKI